MRITTSLTAIFLLSQVTLGQAQVKTDEPELLNPSSHNFVQPNLNSLRIDCEKGHNTNVKGYKHCTGEVAARLFQMLGNKPFNAKATEMTYNNDNRYLGRSLEGPNPITQCWQSLEASNGDPIVIAFYECAVK